MNDLDQWVSSQWENFPTQHPYANKWNGLRQLRKHSNLKEMYIVRYADDFNIFAKTYKEAWKLFQAVRGYLNNHLKLEISPEKSKVTNLTQISLQVISNILKDLLQITTAIFKVVKGQLKSYIL